MKTYDNSASDNSDDEEGAKSDPSYKDTGIIKVKDTQGNVQVLQPNERFLNYKNMFQNLLK